MNYLESSELTNAKNKEIQCIASRAAQRIERMMNIINNTIEDNITIDNPDMVKFKISDAAKKKIASNLIKYVMNYTGISSKPNASIKQKTKPTYKKLRAFWNHKKAEKLGDYLFSVILSMLFQHMVSIPLPNMILLFIDIFCKLLQKTIKYTRTKPLPLICCACFVKQNKFKQFCLTFLEYFSDNIIYSSPQMTKTCRINGKSQTKYVRDSGRAKKQHALYLQCLIKLRKQLQQSTNNRIMQPRIKRLQKWIIENKTSENTNINSMPMPTPMSHIPVQSNQLSYNVHNNCNNNFNNNFIFQSPRMMNNICTQNIRTPMMNMNGRMEVHETKTISDGDCCCSVGYNQFSINQFGNISVNYPQMHDQLFSNNGINNGINDTISNDGSHSSVNDNYVGDNLPPRIDNGFVGSFFDGNMSQCNFTEHDSLFNWNDDQSQQQQQIYI